MTAEAFMYAPIRIVPRVERGEFINAGVIVYSKRLRYLGTRIGLDEARLRALAADTDVEAVRRGLSAFEKACTDGPLAERDLGERFRWLTAPRSAMVQPGPVHSGLTEDPAADLDRLFARLVALVSPRPRSRGKGSGSRSGCSGRPRRSCTRNRSLRSCP